MRTVKDSGGYIRRSTGAEIRFDFEYTVLEGASDIAPAELLALANRMLKVDAGNTARAKAKADNGDAAVRVLSPEEKSRRKAESKEVRELIRLAKAQGMNANDLKMLLDK